VLPYDHIVSTGSLEKSASGFSGTTMADKLSVLPFLNAVFTMQSANEYEGKHGNVLLGVLLPSPKRSQTFCGVKPSNTPSDAITK